ncbi:MAG: Nucleoside triphosphate pyrophosphohydrolase [Steroidobacteraceae bacterium]|nr:Nucleoside triphosphate pyrophosphohydrolase [Steroidobacteraceae bacterium]
MSADGALGRLLAIMARLRAPEGGCPWDREQSFETIAPYTIEEAYEVADAIASGSPERLRGELGDLLFQVVFHARLAEERGWFAFDDIAAAIADKLTQRHPHVFADARYATAADQTAAWEAMKAGEREAAGHRGALADVPVALPALTRAAKLGRRAARVGFDWPDVPATRAKVTEELAELDAAVQGGDAAREAEELGDLLFAIAQWARHLGLDPETALRAANGKFEARFRHMESQAGVAGPPLADLDAEAWDRLWVLAKAAGRST